MQKIKSRFYNKNRRKKKWIPVLLAVLLISGAAFALLEATDKINLFTFDDKKSADPIGPQTKGEPAKGAGGSSSGQIDKGADGSKPQDEDENKSTKPLLAPTGNFVSNHEPNLDSNPAPNSLESVCITTPGATCSISFTKNGIVKTLPAQTADSEGAAYWDWKLQDYDLTEGPWNIQAKAVLGDQTKTTKDPIQLNVQP